MVLKKIYFLASWNIAATAAADDDVEIDLL